MVEAPLPVLVTVCGSAPRPRFRHAHLLLQNRHLEIPVWTADDVNPDFDRLGLSGSPTKVKKVDSVVLTQKDNICVENTQEALNSLADSASTTEAVSKLPSIRGVSLFMGILNVIQALYFIIFHAIYSATPGKMLVHIHVETREGAKIGWGGATARYLCSILTQMTLFFYGLGYLIVCIDPRRRALHDWIARTSVVFNEEARISKAPRSESNDESKEN